MKKIFFCISLVLAGLMSSCVDKYEEVDADSKPSWLGGSIYAELEKPTMLTGTFKTYLRLVDDLGLAETLNRTGSVTVFPANDEAFERFFNGGNDWGVTSYDQLSMAQKKTLLYSSMLDNAMLIGMLPNVSTSGDPLKGRGLKQKIRLSAIDSIQHIADASGMPKGNPSWAAFYNKGIDVVSDDTDPMMVHLTREYMLTNDITTVGDESDFAILTGTPYSPGMAYVFNDRIIKSDVTCQNGYIQQMQDVLVSPGNMAQVIRNHEKTQLMSRMLDYFSAPYRDDIFLKSYNDYAKANNLPQKDSIFQIRYLSSRSQDGKSLISLPDHMGNKQASYLSYDPGWNGYFPKPGKETAGISYEKMDMGAFFVPTDEAIEEYFLPGGNGSFLIDIFGTRYTNKPNNKENLPEHLDSLFAKQPGVVNSFLRNLMKASFVATVPSKFHTVTNDASENMGLTLGLLNRKNDKYDITIANNGVVYVLNKAIEPDEFQAVLAPSSFYPDMKIMDWCVKDGVGTSHNDLGVDFRYYLLAMSANYAFFVPEDSAFNSWYLDPASLGHMVGTERTPEVLHFYYDHEKNTLKCNRHSYDIATGTVDSKATPVSIADVKTQLVDILNYHTLVLKQGEKVGDRHYYKTKHGGTVYIDGGNVGNHAMGEWQLKGELLGRSLAVDTTFRAPTIKTVYDKKNGYTYRIDRVIQAPYESVYSVLNSNSVFSQFMEACAGFSAGDVLSWAGISGDVVKDKNGNNLGYTKQDAYIVFTRDYRLGATNIKNACLDYNVKMFNTYNYTLFAPDNTAMAEAYSKGLPSWSDINALYDKWNPGGASIEEVKSDAQKADSVKAHKMIDEIRDFVRYHFMTGSVYADAVVEGGYKQTLSADANGVARELLVSGGSNVIEITDNTNRKVTVKAQDSGSKVVNKMTRDYWFNGSKETAKAIETSSFCAIHQISVPLCGNSNGRFD